MYVRDGQTYPSYGAYLRGKSIRVAYTASAQGWDYSKQKRWDKELADYRAAVAQGIEPAGTDRASIEQAVKASDEMQAPFKAGKTLPIPEE